MNSRMTIEELASKVEWEGGVEGALDYGVTSDDIEDPQLSALWAKATEAHAVLQYIVADINKILDAVEGALDGTDG